MMRPRASLYRASRATLRSTWLIRPCHPGPVARKCATTSGSRRSDTSFFTGARCFPRARRYAATICGTTSPAGRMRAKSSSVNSRASGSRAIPRRISASSASVISASWRSAFFRAARQAGLSDSFDIFPHVAFLGSAQTDDPRQRPSVRESENVKSHADEADGDLSQFAVVLTVVDEDGCRVPFEGLGSGKVDPMSSNIFAPLDVIPCVSARGCHTLNCSYNQDGSQGDCEGIGA